MNDLPSYSPAPPASADAAAPDAAPSATMSEENKRLLVQGASALGLMLDADAADRFARFAALLAAGNRRLNLTRVRPEEYVTLHFLDSLALAAVHRPASRARILDVGTGAGMPGVPLALVYPNADITLMDSTRKRLTFLDEALSELGVTNAHTLHARAEELARDSQHRAKYDLVVARAVAPLSTLSGWLLPFVKPGGLAVAYKSKEAQEEIESAGPAIAASGGVLEQIADIELPGTNIVRKLAVMRKKH